MDSVSFERIATFVIAFATLVGAIITLVKFGRTPARWLWQHIKPYVTKHKRLSVLEHKVEEIYKVSSVTSSKLDQVGEKITLILEEVQTNGTGVSLKKALRREVESRWRDYDISGKAVWETGRLANGEYGTLRASEPLYRLVGTSPLGKSWLNTIHPDDREEITAAWEQALEEGIVYDRLQRFVHYDNRGRVEKIVHCRAFFKPEYDESGNFTGGLGQCFEMSEEEWEARQL